VIVGGAPVSDAWARQIGADAYAYDAASAVERVRMLARHPA
jgi:methanogenic corrinoid protein MtbC1